MNCHLSLNCAKYVQIYGKFFTSVRFFDFFCPQTKKNPPKPIKSLNSNL